MFPLKKILTAQLILPLLLVAGQLHAQTKIGYTTVELLLAYMPETKTIEQNLSTYQKTLEQAIEFKHNNYQAEVNTYMEKEQNQQWSSDTEKNDLTKKLQGLEQEIQQSAQDAEAKLATRRMELMAPLQEKLQIAINAVAKEGGYTYILNNATGGGIPTILYGLESTDVTKQIAQKLGIAIPQE